MQNKQARNQIIELNPSNKNLTNTQQFVRKDLPKYWEKQFINETLNNIKDHNNSMLCRFLWMTGVRITEAISVKKKDIDFRHYAITIRWLKSRKYNERNIPIHPNLRNILQIYTAAMNLEDKLFPISRQRAWQIIQKEFNGHPHQFRHSFAVNWLRCGGNIVDLHTILGHSRIQTTLEYTKLVPTDLGKELQKISFE